MKKTNKTGIAETHDVKTASPRLNEINISNKKNNEDILKESANNWQTTFDAIKDFVFMLDPEGIILQANIASQKEFDNKENNIIGRRCHDVVHKTDCYFENCPFVRMKLSKNRETMVFNVDNKWFDVVVDPVFDEDNNIKAAVHIIYDITNWKEAELLIQKQNEELRELNSTKDKYFSIIAHDLRDPFNAFVNLIQLIAEDSKSFTAERLSGIFNHMYLLANNLFSLLKNLFDWAETQKGSIQFQPEEFSLSDLISESIILLNENSIQKRINITNSVSPPLKAFADKNMVNSVLLNLLSNALKFTRPGGTVTVNAGISVGNMIEISVMDTGIGIPVGIVNKLFKLGEKTGRKGTGGELSTGLGLLLCKEFVEKNGGKIWLESEEGLGSTFHFTLPFNIS